MEAQVEEWETHPCACPNGHNCGWMVYDINMNPICHRAIDYPQSLSEKANTDE